MYIVKQKVNGGEYYYLRKAVREGKKVTSECIAYLGKNLENAKIRKKEIEEKLLKEKEKDKNMEEKNSLGGEKKMIHKNLTIDELAVFCKRKGFVYASGEIYVNNQTALSTFAYNQSDNSQLLFNYNQTIPAITDINNRLVSY